MEELLHKTSNKSTQNIPTSGYDSTYGGGYATSNIASSIRTTAGSMGTDLLEIAKSEGASFTQTTGYFHFGAGCLVKKENISLTVPSTFVAEKNEQKGELTSVSAEYNSGEQDDSPLEIKVGQVPLQKKMLICEFFQKYITAASQKKRTYSELVVSGRPAVLTMDRTNDSPIARIYVLLHSGLGIYTIKITFKSEFDNTNSIASRIYNNAKITE
ncbi:hypothetical protein AGMMS50284_0610 [Clostridia bacterium]|nr:hypothetical protein AGMMS50284_0610 [Clostridia bacterium]